jgi:hypothetical protein
VVRAAIIGVGSTVRVNAARRHIAEQIETARLFAVPAEPLAAAALAMMYCLWMMD